MFGKGSRKRHGPPGAWLAGTGGMGAGHFGGREAAQAMKKVGNRSRTSSMDSAHRIADEVVDNALRDQPRSNTIAV